MNDLRLNVAAELFESGLEDLLGVNNSQVGVCSQVWRELGRIFVVDANSLRKNGRGLVAWVGLAEADHSLLAGVLRALQGEDSGRRYAVLDEELGLELGLWEVFEEYARGKLLGQAFDQGNCDRFVVIVGETVLLDEVIEVDELHVGSLAESVAECGLSRGLWSNDAGDLGEHCPSGVFVHFEFVTVGVDPSDFAKSLVQVHNWHGLVPECVETLDDSLGVVVGPARCLSSLRQSLDTGVLLAVEEKDILSLTDILFKVSGLVNGSGEAVNKVVLIKNLIQLQQASV